jgi:dTDP-4-dehydrorhamnose 3,5-epimerase
MQAIKGWKFVKILETEIPDVKILEPSVFSDARGYFLETWNSKVFAQAGLDWTFVQDNHSRSHKNVLRGLHYQLRNTQAKLVRVVAGAVFDVAVDIRRASPTFGRWVGAELSETNHRMLWIPAGFAHGFLTLRDDTDLAYKCTDFYTSQHERTIVWDDPELAIAWPLPASEMPLVSAKDAEGLPVRRAEVFT